MAYQRRYFPALTITTTAYGDKSVTTDKLADKAVTTPKVADDAITSDQIVDETIKSGDIKDGEVKTVDIASGAITTDKIASQAVTVDKLEPSIQGIARPLTPGVDTDEIQDAKVTLAKLAPDSVDASKIKPGAVGPTELQVDAVEESRVKDGAISRDKIAGGAIDSTKIAVDAVTGSEILNRCIGNTEIAIEGCHRENIRDEAINTAKLADEAVSAAKLADNAVTADKILDDSILPIKIQVPALSLAKDKEMNRFFDDFMGAAVSPAWVKTGDAGGSVLVGADSIVGIRTGAVNGNAQRIDWGGVLGAGPTNLTFPKFTVGIESRLAADYLTTTIGLWKNANDYIAFYADSVGAGIPTWKARCVKGGNMEEVDTLVPVSTGLQVLEFLFEAIDSVYFDINGVQVAHIVDAAKIPVISADPYLEIVTKTSAFRNMHVDYVSLLQNRVLP